ncbi:MAG TPA: methyltransferase domain-containing protein [Gammaproteobacteria bacterium]|nr:methyltransferase domain-containing protein [Gammaproteobacteria bacterium]
MESNSQIKYLIGNLPEIYQPIYGFNEFDGNSSRSCYDRWWIVQSVADKLRSELQRPLRILDIGCAQGFFCFNLAAVGDEVYGIDIVPQNVELCTELSKVLSLPATFVVADCVAGIDALPIKEFDLIIGLSVFHHLCHHIGFETTRNFIGLLAQRTAACLIETALREEPEKWATSLPDQPYELLDQFAYFQQISHHHTHLSKIQRPIYFCSNHYWYINEELTHFDSWTNTSHEFTNDAHKDSRRYYFTTNTMLKNFQLSGDEAESNREELVGEIKFLQSGFSVTHVLPRLLGFEMHEDSGWVLREKIPGILLSTMIIKGLDYDPNVIIGDILEQLAALEAHGLYHNDLRVWNVLISTQGSVRLIDFGAIEDAARNVMVPKNIFLAFLVFIYEVTHRKIVTIRNLSPMFLKAENYPDIYLNLIQGILSTHPQQWSFSLFLKLFHEGEQKIISAELNNSLRPWLNEIEGLIAKREMKLKYFEKVVIKKLSQESRKNTLQQKLINIFLYNKFLVRFSKFSRYLNRPLVS